MIFAFLNKNNKNNKIIFAFLIKKQKTKNKRIVAVLNKKNNKKNNKRIFAFLINKKRTLH